MTPDEQFDSENRIPKMFKVLYKIHPNEELNQLISQLKYKNPGFEKLRDEMKHDKWYVKFMRWLKVDVWFIRQDIKYYIKKLFI